MILDVPYVSFSEYADKISSPIIAAASMVLSYHGVRHKLNDIESLFSEIILSNEFNKEYLDLRLDYKDTADRSVFCLKQIFDDYFYDISSRLYSTDISKLHGSFTKRFIPVILSGKFPLLSGKVKNHIVVIGIEGKDLIVHDPMGDATTEYKDRNGAFVKYSVSFLEKYIQGEKPLFLITEKENNLN